MDMLYVASNLNQVGDYWNQVRDYWVATDRLGNNGYFATLSAAKWWLEMDGMIR